MALQAHCKEWMTELAEGKTHAAQVMTTPHPQACNHADAIHDQVVRAHWFNGVYGEDRHGMPVNLVRLGRGEHVAAPMIYDTRAYP